MKAPGYVRLRQNPRRRNIGRIFYAVAILGYVVAFTLNSAGIRVLAGIPLMIGGFLIIIGTQASVADDSITIGFTKIPKNRVTLVHMGENATRVHWDGKWGRARSYLFARTSYHPDDWVLLQDHLHALGVSHVESPANSGPQLVEY